MARADDPLAVLAPDAPGGHPDARERIALADAVAQVFTRGGLPDVLSGHETRSRIDALDPAQLTCAVPACASQVALLLHARGVVLVRPSLRDHDLRIEITAVSSSGDVIATESGQAIIGDWEDALALGRVVAARLVPALRPREARGDRSAQPSGGRVPTPVVPEPEEPIERPSVRIGEVLLGAGLAIGGGIAVTIGAVSLASGRRCVSAEEICNPPPTAPPTQPAEYVEPSPLDWVWVGAGGAAVIAGAVLIVHGLTARERRPSVQALATARSETGSVSSLRLPLGVAPVRAGVMFTWGGVF